MSKIIDLTGKTYGNITVINFDSKRGKHRYWFCRCRCGNEWVVSGEALRRQKACRKCGMHKTHGMAASREYKCWMGMIQRCTNKNTPFFKWYGGRGISVCERWRSSFIDFFADMGESPTKKHSLGRIDNDGNYEPGNVEWQDMRTQSLNKRSNHYIEHKGERLTITQWATKLGLNYITIINRLQRGKTLEQAFSPVKPIYEKREREKRRNRALLRY